jgi:hypothetical protein
MKIKTPQQHLLLILKASAAYFGLVFGTGFILGPIRILFVVPRLGERWAELMEMPLMLVVIVLGAKWVVRKFEVPPATGDRLEMGLFTLGLVLLIDFTLVLKLRGLSLTDYFRGLDPISDTAYYLMLGVLAVMPLLIMRRRSPPIIDG